MTDQLLEDLFADLRADGIRTIRPPGAAAAHRAIRRRCQTRRAAGVIGTSAVVAAISVAWWAGPGEHPREAPDATGVQGRQAVPAQRDLVAEAQAAIDTKLLAGTVAAYSWHAGQRDVGAVAQGDGLVGSPANAAAQLAPGSYRLFLACSSTVDSIVTVTIRLTRVGGPVASASAICANQGVQGPALDRSRREFGFSGPKPEAISIDVRGTAPAGTPVGYAFKIVSA